MCATLADVDVVSAASPRLLFVTGFLGAGKTSLISAWARMLTARGERVALVTNDQSEQLVDTALLEASALAGGAAVDVAEVAGACFCCALPSLHDALDTLLERARPSVILCEPVGSCTDIVATLMRPLERRCRDRLRMLPLLGLVDAARIRERGVNADVDYLVAHQLAEADVVCLTKTDTLAPAELERVLDDLGDGDRALAAASVHDAASLAALWDVVERAPCRQRWLRDLDYARYAAAEASLAWLNADFNVETHEPISARELACKVVEYLGYCARAPGLVVGHIKARVVGLNGAIVRAHAASTWGPIVAIDETARDLARAAQRHHQLRINARVTTAPATLLATLDRVLSELGTYRAAPTAPAPSAFRPRPPVPSERITGDGSP